MEKQWYSFMLWGRLAYDPSLPDSHFERILAARHPKASSHHLFRALQGASQVMPLTTRFFWGDIDLKWYPEACLSHPRSKGFYTVRHFMEGISMPGSGNLCIRDWRRRLQERRPMQDTTPLQIADRLRGLALETERLVEDTPPARRRSAELAATLDDFTSFALLGHYYAEKIRAACALALYDSTATPPSRPRRCVTSNRPGALETYAAVRDARYVPAIYNRVGYVDITALTGKVAADLELARIGRPAR